MGQAVLNITPQRYEIHELSHAINNRMNAISLSMALLQKNDDPNVRVLATAMKSELHDLEDLIQELKRHA